MLDHLRLALFFKPDWIHQFDKNKFCLTHDVTFFGVSAACRQLWQDEDGELQHSELYHSFESLPSSFTPMAFKIYHLGINTLPRVEIKASPAKLLQGHNVYGTDSIRTGATVMLSLLFKTYPFLARFLDLHAIEVMHLDATYHSRLKSQSLVQPVLEYMKNVEAGHVKINRDATRHNTVRWDSNDSVYYQRKLYGKHTELLNSMKTLLKKQQRGCLASAATLQAINYKELINYAQGLCRWEARIKKRRLEKLGISNNLYELIDHQETTPNFLSSLWQQSFSPIFKALEGHEMNYFDDADVLDLLKDKLQTVTKPRKSYFLANRLFDLHLSMRDRGYLSVRLDYDSKIKFRTDYQLLLKAGIPEQCYTDIRMFTFNDDVALSLLQKKYVKYSTPRVSYTKALNAFNFYQSIRNQGLDVLKQQMPSSTYYLNVKNLTDSGIPLTALQNLHTQKHGTVVPFIDFCKVDFDNQTPANYITPEADFSEVFKTLDFDYELV